LSEPWSFLAVALCAIVGYAVVAAFLRKREALRKRSEDAGDASHTEDSKHGGGATEQWYEILNVSPTASVEEIQAAFRIEIGKYHPDRVANLGFELRALAESRSKKITNAYTLGLRIRGAGRNTRR
jgi:DnaJ-domain-containing protein 1